MSSAGDKLIASLKRNMEVFNNIFARKMKSGEFKGFENLAKLLQMPVPERLKGMTFGSDAHVVDIEYFDEQGRYQTLGKDLFSMIEKQEALLKSPDLMEKLLRVEGDQAALVLKELKRVAGLTTMTATMGQLADKLIFKAGGKEMDSFKLIQGKFAEPGQWGTFIEHKLFGVAGGGHSTPDPDVLVRDAKDIYGEDPLRMEVKATFLYKLILVGQAKASGFRDIDNLFVQEAGKKGFYPENFTPEEKDYFTTVYALNKIAKKMANFLYIGMEQAGGESITYKTERGQEKTAYSHMGIAILVLFTTLYLKKVALMIFNTITARAEKMSGPYKLISGTAGGVGADTGIFEKDWKAVIGTGGKDFLESLQKITELYLMRLDIIEDHKFRGPDWQNKTIFQFLSERREMFSVNENAMKK